MREVYADLSRAVEGAGFFTTGMPMDGGGDRIVCASKFIGGALRGNSFWIAERDGDWFLGAWGPHLYRIPDAEKVADLCITWLRQEPDKTRADLDECVKREFALIEISPDLPL